MIGPSRQPNIVYSLLRSLAVITVFILPLTVLARDQISKPGVYSGYTDMLYKEVVHSSRYIEMRDGTKLAATIYRPARDGKAVETAYPVIWEGTTSRGRRNPDGTVLLSTAMFPPRRDVIAGGLSSILDIVRFGYVLVQVERRGQSASMGFMRGYHDWTESLDAYDITEWLADQSWSDGNIGVFGCSNTGEAALHAPSAMPPHLKAVFAGCYSWNKYDGLLRGGILANWGTGPQSSPQSAGLTAIPVDEDKDESMLKQAIAEHGSQTILLSLWKSMPYRDNWSDIVSSRFWLEGSVSTYQAAVERTDVGIYSFGGWYDDFRREGIIAFNALHNPSKLLLGPWGHCSTRGFDLDAERLRFFDYWLKGIDNGIMDEPPITYYTVGAPEEEAWRNTLEWPLPNEKPAKYYLGSGGVLSANAPVNADGRDEYTVNYDVDCPKAVGLGQTCVLDDKGITYTSEVLQNSMELTGHPILHLWVASSTAENNFFTYLEDVAPDGSVFIVTDGRLKGSLRTLSTPPYHYKDIPYHRSFQEDAMPFSPGKPEEVVFDCLPLSHVFKPGHRIRLTITGADPREKDRVNLSPPPVITIFTGSTHSSYVKLPVIPDNTAAGAPELISSIKNGRSYK